MVNIILLLMQMSEIIWWIIKLLKIICFWARSLDINQRNLHRFNPVTQTCWPGPVYSWIIRCAWWGHIYRRFKYWWGLGNSVSMKYVANHFLCNIGDILKSDLMLYCHYSVKMYIISRHFINIYVVSFLHCIHIWIVHIDLCGNEYYIHVWLAKLTKRVRPIPLPMCELSIKNYISFL